MSLARFKFSFAAESDPHIAMPYVARLSWNHRHKELDKDMLALPRQPVAPHCVRVAGEFTAAVGDIIEARKGYLKRPRRQIDLRAWYLVSPTGYLILVAEATDLVQQHKVAQYLAGTLSVEALSDRKWDFQTVTGTWRGQLMPTARASSGSPDMEQLRARKRQLQHDLAELEAELHRLDGEESTPSEESPQGTGDAPVSNRAYVIKNTGHKRSSPR
jgi:hypothetical protein